MTLPDLTLVRYTPFRDVCVLGVLLESPTSLLCRTLELPYRDDRRDASSLPEGRYRVRPFHSARLGPVFRFDDTDVAPRVGVEIHPGNTPHNTHGCVLIGTYHGILGGLPAVLDSRVTLDMLLRKYKDGFMLGIEDRTRT